ncbi:cytochrome c oxidase assembly factor Coa1 family protein [Pseudoxanthomonas sp. UTMC 1351]|uniref:cytochrome c oxidase assembly factor Coa1 family protein n=1 Tax=Pseudoxanthomonas sp. UTMC 1351 TaxID=2695853 RepID=UPI0034D02059
MNATNVPQPNWWGRNWKWFVPVLAVVMLALFAAFFAAIFAFVFGMMKSSEPYREAVARATANPQIVQALGEPIESGYFVQGNISTQGTTGEANLAIPLKGPKGSAKVYVDASQSAGRWEYKTLVVQIEGSHQRVDLLEGNDELEVQSEF